MYLLFILIAFIFATIGSIDLIRYIDSKINTTGPKHKHKPIYYLLKSITLFICVGIVYLSIIKLNIHPSQTIKLR